VFLSVNIFNEKGLTVLTVSVNNRDVPRITTVEEMENEGLFRSACLPVEWCNKTGLATPLCIIVGKKTGHSWNECPGKRKNFPEVI